MRAFSKWVCPKENSERRPVCHQTLPEADKPNNELQITFAPSS